MEKTNFKGTKGEAKLHFHSSKNNTYLRVSIDNKDRLKHILYDYKLADDECSVLECNCIGESKFNAELIADAFNVRQQINIDLPELLDRHNQLESIFLNLQIQELGNVLNLEPGADISINLLPVVKKLVEQRNEMLEMLKDIQNRIENTDILYLEPIKQLIKKATTL